MVTASLVMPAWQYTGIRIEGRMANVAARNEVNHVLGDICGVITNSLEVFCHKHQFECGKNNRRIFHHVSEQLSEHLIPADWRGS